MSDDFGRNAMQVSERRIAPRHKVRLRASVLITAVARDSRDDGDEEQYFALQGQLLDISRSGLAIIISGEDRQELKSLGKDTIVLQLLLPLPARAIELEAVPARFAEINLREKKKVLLGAHITRMSERDRILFEDFISRCEPVNQASRL